MKIYLDNCLFNRPFDEQSHIRIRIETEEKLAIQEEIRRGTYQLIWSYILDYENSKNPFRERHKCVAISLRVFGSASFACKSGKA